MPTREILDHCETRESYYCPRSFRKMPNRKTTDAEPMDRILLWAAVQSRGQWRSISTELSPDTQGMTTPSFAKKWRLQYNYWRKGNQMDSTTSQKKGPSRWRGCNHRSHDNLKQDLADRRVANPLDQSLDITLPKKGSLQQCQNYRIISLISHPSKVMLKIILNRLKPQAEKIIIEEQAGFRARRSTTE